MMNKGAVYALWDYEAQNSDELSFHEGDAITILRRKDESETDWWWARLGDREGYVPKNLLGVSTWHARRLCWKVSWLCVLVPKSQDPPHGRGLVLLGTTFLLKPQQPALYMGKPLLCRVEVLGFRQSPWK